MGTMVSYFHDTSETNEPDVITGLTPREVSLVQNSWTLVKNDLLGAGVELFMIYFKKYPEYQHYFPFRKVPYEELRTNEKLHSHALKVMNALSVVIDNLGNSSALVNILIDSGKFHARKKIPENAYWDLKLCIMELLQTSIGPKLTQEATQAWDKSLTAAIGVILTELSSGSTKV